MVGIFYKLRLFFCGPFAIVGNLYSRVKVRRSCMLAFCRGSRSPTLPQDLTGTCSAGLTLPVAKSPVYILIKFQPKLAVVKIIAISFTLANMLATAGLSKLMEKVGQEMKAC